MGVTESVTGTQARNLLVGLVSTPSPSGEESAVATRLVDFFEAHGREVWLDEVGNVRAPGDIGVLLTSHMDTVPGDIPVRIEADSTYGTGECGEVLWGRGSVDATGALAAMAVAAVRTGTSFAGVVREETDSGGARHLIETSEEPAALINGEPSGWDAITLGYRGYLPATYQVETESAHTSRPEPNAIQHATAWWQAVESVVETEFSSPDSVFEAVTATPVQFDGGLTADGHAVEATVNAEFRVPPDVAVADLKATVVEETAIGSIEWGPETPPVMASPRTPVARAFRAAIRAEGETPRMLRKTGTADVNLYAEAWDCPTATYGPGNSALDHAPDERLSLAEFDRSIAVLTRVGADLADGSAAAGDQCTAVDPGGVS